MYAIYSPALTYHNQKLHIKPTPSLLCNTKWIALQHNGKDP